MIACHPCPEAADIQDQPNKIFHEKTCVSRINRIFAAFKMKCGMDQAAHSGIFYALTLLKR